MTALQAQSARPTQSATHAAGRLRVAFVTAFPRDPSHPHGGVEAVSTVLVRALARLSNLDVQVVTTDPDPARVGTDQWESATIHRLPRSGRWTLTDALFSGRRTVSNFVTRLRPDVVHAHDVFGLMVKGLPLPRVFTVHGFIHADTLVSGGRFARLRATIWKRIELAGWAEQPHIISISPYVRERLTGVARGVIHDIDNPISPEFFDLPNLPTVPTIFCAALLCRRKNQLMLVEALRRLDDLGVRAELRLAGSESDEMYTREVRRRAADVGVAERVRFLGPLSGDQIRDELTRASIFALPSLEEGSPMGIEEAMAAGVPVVTSNRCGMPYMVRDGESGYLIDPLDSEDIARRFERILSDAALWSRMSAESRRIARDRFHPEVVARRTRAVYERAVGLSLSGSRHAHD